MIRYFAPLLLLMLLSFTTHAYSLSNHKKITLWAAAEYNSYTGNPLEGKYIEQLVKGNLSEDKRLLRKFRHWHFYNPSKDLSPQHTFATLFSELATELDSMIAKREPKKNIYFKLGQIIHFLQDITCPPHVIPVSHGAHDRFDNLDITNIYHPEKLGKEGFDTLRQSALLNPGNLLAFYSSQTHASINRSFPAEVNGRQEQMQWSYFWQAEGGPVKGFGRYGKAGNCFGSLQFTEEEETLVTKYEIASSTYKTFVQERVRAAQNVTLRAILYVQEKLKAY
jgi:hypothetical protein